MEQNTPPADVIATHVQHAGKSGKRGSPDDDLLYFADFKKPAQKVIRWHRAAKQIPLIRRTAIGGQKLALFLGFDALGNDAQ